VVDPQGGEHKPHVPSPSLWPVGFAIGVAVLLLGLIVGWHIVVLGAVLTIAFGFLWIRDVTAGMRGPVAEIEPERREVRPGSAPPATEGEWGAPLADDEEVERYPRNKFLEGATLGISGVIGGLVTLPVLGFAVIPAFNLEDIELRDIGALDDFPEGEWRIVTFLKDPDQGEVSRRTAYVRNNGLLDGAPSFTIVSNRCVHLGCPVQPNGPVDDDAAQEERTESTVVRRIPTNPAGFGCPCHGGQYDDEGNRTAGPPVRALDRYDYSIRNGRVLLSNTYSVGEVRGEGREAVIVRYDQAYPGIHVDGPEQILYPLEPPR
jgi:quinol---cytochrome c reductase iron-sulfur subunit, bacillus type